MENKTIEELLNGLTNLVGDARGSLFGQDRCMVDRDQLIFLVESLQAQLPKEIMQSRSVIDNCNAIRTNAKKDAAETRREADKVLAEAEERAARMVEETTIVENAKKREEEIIADASEKREQLIAGAVSYAERIIQEAQQTVAITMQTLDEGMAALQAKAQEELSVSMQKLSEAKNALASISGSVNE